MNILREYDKNVDIIGLDEAFLDLTPYCEENYVTTHGELESIIIEIKFKIYDQAKLTCSIGISSNKMLAKICSDKNKPDGFFKLITDNPDEIMMFMSNMNIRKIPFVGEKSEQKLNLLEIKTCSDFLKRFVDLFYVLHINKWEFLIKCCFGIGSAYHEEIRVAINKSISCSETFKMTNDINKIKKIFEALVKRLFNSMLEDQIIGKNLGLEIKDKKDNTVSKSTSLKKYFETETEIRERGWNTLYSMIQNTSIRLIRVKMSGLSQINPEQMMKKKDKPIMKFLDKMNNADGSILRLRTNNSDNISKEKNNILGFNTSKMTINHANISNFHQENQMQGKSKKLNDNSIKKNDNLRKITKEKDLITMFSNTSQSKPINTFNEGLNDKNIFKTTAAVISNKNAIKYKIDVYDNISKFTKPRELNESRSKNKTKKNTSGKKKKKAKDTPKNQNQIKIDTFFSKFNPEKE